MASMLTDVINAGTGLSRARRRASRCRRPARPARPTTTSTPGSSASRRRWSPASGSGSISRRRSSSAATPAIWRCRCGPTFMKAATKGDKPVWLKPPADVVSRPDLPDVGPPPGLELRRGRGRVEDRRDQGPLDDHVRVLRQGHRALRRVPAALRRRPADRASAACSAAADAPQAGVAKRRRRCPSAAVEAPPASAQRRRRAGRDAQGRRAGRTEEEARLLGTHLRLAQEPARRRSARTIRARTIRR